MSLKQKSNRSIIQQREDKKKYDFQSIPDKNYRFFLSDREEGEVLFFRTEQERDKYAKVEAIPEYIEDTWYEDSVTGIHAGEVTHLIQKTNVVKRPPDNEIDEDGDDENGVYWSDYSEICDYELLPINDPPAPGFGGKCREYEIALLNALEELEQNEDLDVTAIEIIKTALVGKQEP